MSELNERQISGTSPSADSTQAFILRKINVNKKMVDEVVVNFASVNHQYAWHHLDR